MVVLEGLLVGAVGDSSIKVWRMDSWEQTGVLSGHRGLVLALACFGDRLISGSDDRCIRVWRMGTTITILNGPRGSKIDGRESWRIFDLRTPPDLFFFLDF